MYKNKADLKKRKVYHLNENRHTVLNFILKETRIRKFLKYYCLVTFVEKSTFSHVTSKNRCVITGRSKSVYNFSRISRLVLRENFFINKLPGLKKSYW